MQLMIPLLFSKQTVELKRDVKAVCVLLDDHYEHKSPVKIFVAYFFHSIFLPIHGFFMFGVGAKFLFKYF